MKSWRPINLINCVGKLGEKVVADTLQEGTYYTDTSSGDSGEVPHWKRFFER